MVTQHPQEDIQLTQSAYRRRIVDTWQIAPGSRTLELGCGQGDMTAVLAEAVGPEGHVLAVDIADPSYGAPLTLAEATGALKESDLGARIEFRFNCDILSPDISFEPDSFDCVVMAHSPWYFASLSQLAQTLGKVRPWARKLCFAEWDMAAQTHAQMAHMLAVLIQGQVEAFKASSEANVRTPFTRGVIMRLLAESGWMVTSESSVDSSSLQDGDWEISACLALHLDPALPAKFLALIESEIEMLREIAVAHGNPPLPCYSLVASRG